MIPPKSPREQRGRQTFAIKSKSGLIRIQASACFRFLIGRIYSGNIQAKKAMKSKVTIISQFCVLSLMVAVLSLAGMAIAQDAPASKSSSLSVKDKTFMKKAARGGMTEVAMGKLAEQNGQSDDVKSFGKRMVTDHSKANDELKSIAAQKGVKLPSKEPALKWNSDKSYMDMMVKDHEKDLAEFQEEAKTGSDPEVKKFAEGTAKVVKEHLDLAKETQSKLQ
jgi:putative membrane protein